MALSTTREPPIVPDKVKVKPGAKNTVVDPFDPVDPAESVWFPSEIGKSTVRGPNEVVPYIFGHKLYKDVVAAMRTATTKDHFIYLLGWNLDVAFPLIDGDPSSTITALFTAADQKGVQIRAMVYRHEPHFAARDNAPAVKFINGLANGVAILDQRVVRGGILVQIKADYVGAHHQKVIVINGSEGLIVFQGGYDLDPDRLHFGNPDQGGLHDVQTRIRGLMAGSFWQLFIERWEDHPDSVTLTGKKRPVPKTLTDAAKITENLSVEVGRTFPNCNSHTLTDPGTPYKFAATGDQTAKRLVLNAIGQAKKFIYLEDQYLVDMSISDALKAALPNIKKLIILITSTLSIEGELRQAWARRKSFVDNLTAAAPGKVIVCQLRSGYVHSKSWIFDDKFAIVGSANVNRRGYSHDSEQNAGIFDRNDRKRFFFAHELRMNLWAKHLKKRPIDFVDPIASSVHWSTPIGEVIAYDPNADIDHNPAPALIPNGVLWDVGIDPDGT